VLFCAFGFVASTLFGRDQYAFSTISRASFSQLEVITGAFNRQANAGHNFPNVTLCFYALHYFVFSFLIMNFALAFFVEAWLFQITQIKEAGGVKTRDYKKVMRYNRNKLFYSMKTILTPRFFARRWSEDVVLSKLKRWKGTKYDPKESKYLQLKTLRDMMGDKDTKGKPTGIAKAPYHMTLDFQPLELYLLNSESLISHLEKELLVSLEEDGGDAATDEVIADDAAALSHHGSNVRESELNELQKAFQELEGLQKDQLTKFGKTVKDLRKKHEVILKHLDGFANCLKRFDPPKFDNKED